MVAFGAMRVYEWKDELLRLFSITIKSAQGARTLDTIYSWDYDIQLVVELLV